MNIDQDNAQLRKELTLYHAIIDTMEEGVTVQDAQGRIVMSNPAAEKILGLPATGIHGRNPATSQWRVSDKDDLLFTPERHPATRALRTGKPQSNVTMKLEKPDGTHLWIIVNCQPLIRENETQPYGVVSTFFDITQRLRAESRTHWLSQFPAENPNPVLRVAPNGTIIYANASSTGLLAAWGSQLHSTIPQTVFDTVAAALRDEASHTMEVDLGEQVLTLTFAPDADGHYVNIYGLDITSRKLAEKALRDNEEATRMLLQAAPVGVVVADENGRIVLINDSATRIFGYTDTELLEQPLASLIPEKSRAVHVHHYQTYIDTPRTRPMGNGLDLKALHKDGHTFPVEISLGYVQTARGVLTMAFILDVTKQHELEQMREAMLHTMVHDLRNPLGAIYTGLAFLKQDVKDSLKEQHWYVLNVAVRNTNRMLTLVNSILDVNQLESGQMPIHQSTFSLHELTIDTLVSLATLVNEKKLHIHNRISPTLPNVWADEQLIGRVLQNLIGNAIKFTPNSGAITVTARQETNGKISVAVSDTGPGISPEIRDRLFQQFATGKHKQRGNGLGLAFCKLALNAHGESITAKSEPGQGTTFTFTLPVAP